MKQFTFSLKDRFSLSSTSDGEQLKWFKDNMYIKADVKGYESITEVLASEFQRYIKNSLFVDYTLCKIVEGNKVYTGCYSEKWNTRLISVYRLLQLYIPDFDEKLRVESNTFDYINYNIEDITGLDFQGYLERLLAFDYIICNTDRHFNNIFIGIENETGYFVDAPVLDNGAGFMSDLLRFPIDLTYNQMLDRLTCNPFYTDFNKQISLVENEILYIDYDNFLNNLENKCVEFKCEEFERAKMILINRLKETYGKLWIKY